MEAMLKARELFPNLETTSDVTAAVASIDLEDLEPLGSTSWEEDPDAFHEGDAFTVQQEEEDADYEWEESVDRDNM